MTYDVVVIGGGLAGCSAAIQLAEQGRAVLLLEKQHYPAHKLCGEFLSVEAMAAFERLGVLDAVHAAGAHRIDQVCITTTGGPAFASRLPGTALGLSRYRLDHLLFQRASAVGATARDGLPVRSVTGSLHEGFQVEAGGDVFRGRVVLGAYGKRGVLDRKLSRPFFNVPAPLVGFKAHYEGLHMPGLIELHGFPGGYCGLSHVEGQRVNVCWIAHQRLLKDAGGEVEAMIDRSLCRNAHLAERLGGMQRVSPTFTAVSQVSFQTKSPFDADVCMIGDTAGMITPLCGDGMAMALHSAALAVPFVAAFLEGRTEAAAFRRGYASAWEAAFRTRLRLGRWMHYGYMQPTAARLGVGLLGHVPALGRWLIRKTRG